MVDEKLQRAPPRDVPDYHERQAAHYRALAEMVTTPVVKARLLREAEAHERVADEPFSPRSKRSLTRRGSYVRPIATRARFWLRRRGRARLRGSGYG